MSQINENKIIIFLANSAYFMYIVNNAEIEKIKTYSGNYRFNVLGKDINCSFKNVQYTIIDNIPDFPIYSLSEDNIFID